MNTTKIVRWYGEQTSYLRQLNHPTLVEFGPLGSIQNCFEGFRCPHSVCMPYRAGFEIILPCIVSFAILLC
jgi:hypothetical protein